MNGTSSIVYKDYLVNERGKGGSFINCLLPPTPISPRKTHLETFSGLYKMGLFNWPRPQNFSHILSPKETDPFQNLFEDVLHPNNIIYQTDSCVLFQVELQTVKPER